MRYLILTLLLSFSFSECDDLNALQCSSNTDCEWIEDITTGSCSSLSNSQQCNSAPGCNWDCIQWGWWYNWCYTYGCEGGTYEIDNSYCQENPNPPACSELNENHCNHPEYGEGCDWVENIELGNCSDITNSSECYETNQCSWYNAGNYGYWYDNCYGGTYEIDNSYCEESNYMQGDLNGDSIINVLDVIAIVDIILNQESSDLADMNGDGIINILDVIDLIEIILE